MTNKLISLALLIIFLTTGYSYSENQFIFPKKKPSVFKKIEKIKKPETSITLPQRKPITQVENNKIDKNDKLIKKKEEIKKLN